VEDNKELEQKPVVKGTYFNRETQQTITEPLDISYYKNLQFEEIIENNLLGDFDNFGNYSISKDILIELVAAKKIIKESKDEKFLLFAPVKEGFEKLTFTLQIEDGQNDKKVAILGLVETDNKWDGNKEFFKTIIAKYKDDDDIFFMDKVKKAFNIIDSEDGGKTINNEEFLKIIIKKFKGYKDLKSQDTKFEDAAQKYIDGILAILKNNPGKYSEFILRNYNVYIEEMKPLVGNPKYYKQLRNKLEILLVETRKNFKEPVIDPLIDIVRKEYLESLKTIQKDALEEKVVVAKPATKEKPKEVKKEESSSGAKKSASKSSPKKEESKKAAKKKEDAKNYPPLKDDEIIKSKIEFALISEKEKAKDKLNISKNKTNDIAKDSLSKALIDFQWELEETILAGSISTRKTKTDGVVIAEEVIIETSKKVTKEFSL
jgi:hypothetical protein